MRLIVESQSGIGVQLAKCQENGAYSGKFLTFADYKTISALPDAKPEPKVEVKAQYATPRNSRR